MPLTLLGFVSPHGKQNPEPQGFPVQKPSISHYRALARLTF
jgi:hypothetical protein